METQKEEDKNIDIGSTDPVIDQHTAQENDEISKIRFEIPLNKNLVLKEHQNLISSFTLDSCKNRLVVGSSDYKISFWDLLNINLNFKPFRVLEPHEKQMITAVSFNADDSRILVCGGGAKPKLLTRDGRQVVEFMKGDMYIRDLLYTKGHTSSVTDGFFNPQSSERCYTSSMDGTIRIWDINAKLFGVEQQLPCSFVIKCKTNVLQRSSVNKCSVTESGLVIGLCEDNSIQCFSEKTKFLRPEMLLRNPQVNQATAIKVLRDQTTFITREMDDTVKLYDLRQFSNPKMVFSNLPNHFPHTGICLSESEDFFVTGTSITKTRGAELVLQEISDSSNNTRIPMGEETISAINWDHTLNQIFIGIGNSINIFYDPIKSKKGVVGIENRPVKKRVIEDEFGDKAIYVPNALSMFRPDQNNKRKRFEKIRGDDILTKKPNEMLTGPGFNGLLSGPRTTAQFVMKTIHELRGKRIDPLESLKKYADVARENPQFVDSAYLLTQPKKILDYSTSEGDQSRLMSMFNKCKHCGLKICQCTTKKGTY